MKIMLRVMVDGVERYELGYDTRSAHNEKVREVFGRHVAECCRMVELGLDPNDPESWKDSRLTQSDYAALRHR